jgi:hypothetical protein
MGGGDQSPVVPRFRARRLAIKGVRLSCSTHAIPQSQATHSENQTAFTEIEGAGGVGTYVPEMRLFV